MKIMKKITKKVWPSYFEKLLTGEKCFELRLADWNCQPGDVLVLQEWDPETKVYTGRQIEKEVVYLVKTKDCQFWSQKEIDKHGFQVIGLR